MSKKCEDIFTLHAPLIHRATEIIFKLAYDNDGDPATITDLPEGKNVQRVLEAYFSRVGIPVQNEIPTGDQNNINLTYTTSNEFLPDSLEVYLSGLKLVPGLDFDIITTGPNTNKGFVIKLDPNDSIRLNCPPQQGEPLTVNYEKRITFNTKGGL